MEPVTYPEVTVGGKPYLVRFGLNAVYRLSSWGIEADRLKSILEEFQTNHARVENIFTLIAAGLGTLVDGQWHSAKFTPDNLADTLLDGEFPMLAAKLADALGKASPGGTNSASPTPETPNPPTSTPIN